MADYPVFVQNHVLTPKGLELTEWIEAQYRQYDKPGADANIAALNSLHGPVAEYYVNVEKLKVSPAKWMESFPQSARNAHDIMTWVAQEVAKKTQQEQAVTEATTISNTVADELAKFKESIAAQVSELENQVKTLRDENEALKTANKVAEQPAAEVEAVVVEPVKPAKKAKKVEAEPETETPADAPVESEGETPAESE